MSDQEALRQMVRLFDNWNAGRNLGTGFAPFRDVFQQIHTIRRWSSIDRIRDTHVIEDWGNRLVSGETVIPFECEFWFRNSPVRREQAFSYLQSTLEPLGGEIIQQCTLPEIAYHGAISNVPRLAIEALVANPELTAHDVRFLQCEDVMRIYPVGQCAAYVPDDTNYEPMPSQPESIPTRDPIIALLDGLPLENHELLRNRISIDDPDDYRNIDIARNRVHGTAMASLICHGDKNNNNQPLSRLLYARPILQSGQDFNGNPFESVPENTLIVDLVHRAVRRLFEEENGDEPAAPEVRIINLSIGNPSQPFIREISPLARLIDWLSHKYNVLFIISAGNQTQDIELDVSQTEFNALTPKRMQDMVIGSLARDTRHRRLLSPAESINGLTIGAIHEDSSSGTAHAHLLDPYAESGLPSLLNGHGPGHKRSVKPEILLPGGKQLLSERISGDPTGTRLEVRRYNSSPGQRVATPGNAGQLNQTHHVRGTSNAAALASRAANFLHDTIEQLRGGVDSTLPREYDSVLLKTLLVHGASWGNILYVYESTLKGPHNSRVFREYAGHFIGYGAVDFQKVMSCTDQMVTILGVGDLVDDQSDTFVFPLPPSLSSVTTKRRLTITLSWLTPIFNKETGYRGASLTFTPAYQLTPNRIDADHNAVKRGTVQHEVLEGDQAVAFQSGDALAIKVDCRFDNVAVIDPVRYALAVTLEIAEDIDIPIYQEVYDRLLAQVAVRIP